jgi:hypothetical protein
MEGLARTSTDINWSTQGDIQLKPFTNHGQVVAANTTENVLAPNYCVFSAVCDWNLIMMSNDTPIPNQCYSTQTRLNI